MGFAAPLKNSCDHCCDPVITDHNNEFATGVNGCENSCDHGCDHDYCDCCDPVVNRKCHVDPAPLFEHPTAYT
jgi:hypothetical protein